ncbi:MAG: alpha/beta hydrolase [Nitratireductor sp.]
MTGLPAGFRSGFADCGEVRLHFVTNGEHDLGRTPAISDPRPVIVFLHGFPEYWAAWEPVMTRLAQDYLVIAPDQRGFNLSDAPERAENYATKKLVSDLLALTSTLIGNRKFVLAGHDWGASVAYAIAIGAPERISALIIVNGVHPVLFQRALVEDAAQREASQYFHILTAEGAAGRMSENGFARTFSMFEKFSSTPWLGPEERQGYLDAWSQPGRLQAMLHWYRSSPIVVPKPGEAGIEAPLASGTPARYGISMPHLVVWGMKDPALLPVSRLGLEAFAPKLQLVEIPDADHWIIHTHGEIVAGEIMKFLDTRENAK